jgi:tetratricopeptide (TPR) repeat protein
MQKGDLQAAVAEYRTLVAAEPGNAEAFYNLGTALKQQDDFAGAEQALLEAVRLEPDLPEAHFTLGVVFWQTRRPEEAAAQFRAALAQKPAYAEAHYMLGTVLRQMGQHEQAMAEFRATLAADPESAEAWLSIGQLLQREHDTSGSAQAFAEADRLRKKKADAQAATFAVSTGMQKLAAGDVAAAITSLRDAVRLAPDNAQAHFQLARALERTGNAAEAREQYDEARRLAPGLVPPHAQ